MADAGRPVPGRSHIPFHVRIIGEELTVFVKGNIKRITETRADQLPVFPFRVSPGDPSARWRLVVAKAIRVRQERQQVIILPGSRQPVIIHRGQIGKITGHHVKRLFVGRQYNTVRSMLARAFQPLQQRDLVKLVVTIGILKAVNAAWPGKRIRFALVVYGNIQAVKGVQQPMRQAHFYLCRGSVTWHVDLQLLHLDLCGGSVSAGRGNGNPVQVAILVTRDNPALVVEGHSHPRTLFMISWRVQALRMKVRRYFQFGHHRIFRNLVMITARLVTGGGQKHPAQQSQQ